MNGIFIIAHAPLASALQQCITHVFSEQPPNLVALDVQSHAGAEETLALARAMLAQLGTPHTLVLTDVFGATPCNVAQALVDGVQTKLVTGVNLPMLLRTVSYRYESLEALTARAVAGGTQGVMLVNLTAPQNQAPRNHDQNAYHHQQ